MAAPATRAAAPAEDDSRYSAAIVCARLACFTCFTGFFFDFAVRAVFFEILFPGVAAASGAGTAGVPVATASGNVAAPTPEPSGADASATEVGVAAAFAAGDDDGSADGAEDAAAIASGVDVGAGFGFVAEAGREPLSTTNAISAAPTSPVPPAPRRNVPARGRRRVRVARKSGARGVRGDGADAGEAGRMIERGILSPSTFGTWSAARATTVPRIRGVSP